MSEFNYCCGTDGHGLSYPGFSAIFIQTFYLHHTQSFCVEERGVDIPNSGEEAAAEKEFATGVSQQSNNVSEIAPFEGSANVKEDGSQGSEQGEQEEEEKDILEQMQQENLWIKYVPQNIEKQIFTLSSDHEKLETLYRCKSFNSVHRLIRKRGLRPDSILSKVKVFPGRSVYRFALRGFDFEMPFDFKDDELDNIILKGKARVELSLFFGNTVSLTYRFLFDGEAAEILDKLSGEKSAVVTDHIIALLSTFLAGEYWSRDLDGKTEQMASQSFIDLTTYLKVRNFWYDNNGNPLSEPIPEIDLTGSGRTFDPICLAYKRYITKYCTAFSEGLTFDDIKTAYPHTQTISNSAQDDLHYAMVDIWENIAHFDKYGKDLFEKKERIKDDDIILSEAEIVNHIRDYHKPELIGLMTLYPQEWRYRDPQAYDEVCGENIAIDTDDLVLAGSNVSVVIGTYGRRGADDPGVDWEDHLKERAKYHVSWPEYLMILQMVLAKKYNVNIVKEQLIKVSMATSNNTHEELIGENALMSMRLNRKLLQLDMVQYSKFASHLVMSGRTTRRLGLNEDMENLKSVIEMVDNSLQNLSNFKAMKSDFFLNIVLAIISIASTFELFFQDSRMPFLQHLFGVETKGLASYLVAVVAALTFFALLIVIKNSIKKFWYVFVK